MQLAHCGVQGTEINKCAAVVNSVSRAPKSDHEVHEWDTREPLTSEVFSVFLLVGTRASVANYSAGMYMTNKFSSENHFTGLGGTNKINSLQESRREVQRYRRSAYELGEGEREITETETERPKVRS